MIVTRKGQVEADHEQGGPIAFFNDINHRLDIDDKEILEATVCGKDRADLLWEISYMLAHADFAPRDKYNVFFLDEDVVIAEIDSKYIDTTEPR